MHYPDIEHPNKLYKWMILFILSHVTNLTSICVLLILLTRYSLQQHRLEFVNITKLVCALMCLIR